MRPNAQDAKMSPFPVNAIRANQLLKLHLALSVTLQHVTRAWLPSAEAQDLVQEIALSRIENAI